MGSGQRRAPPHAPSDRIASSDSRTFLIKGGNERGSTSSSSSSTSSSSSREDCYGDGGCKDESDDEDDPVFARGGGGGGSRRVDFQAERKPLIAPTSAGAGGEEGVGTKKASELWRIHGRHFDLTPFVAHHPGGSSILEAMRGAEDITPVFESYHALADTAAIRRSLQKFEWTGKLVDDVSEREAALVGGSGKEPVRYRWDESGFYAVLTGRVKSHFLEKNGQKGADPRRTSVNRFVKAPPLWYLKELLILVVYLPLLASMLGYNVFFPSLAVGGDGSSPVPRWMRAAAAMLAGALLQSFSFCTLHDASHYGLLFKRPRVQEVVSRVCNAWTLWHHGLWVMHHVYGHHSFTGDPDRDPDLVHARPYLRKSVLAPEDQYDPFLVRWQRFLAPLFMMVVPGASLGQTQAYLRGLREGNLWHVSITAASGQTRWYEYLTYFFAVGLHVLGGSLSVSFCYFMGISIAYHLCVAPDHDTFESSIVNSIETKREVERERLEAAANSGRSSSRSGSGSGSGGCRESPPSSNCRDCETSSSSSSRDGGSSSALPGASAVDVRERSNGGGGGGDESDAAAHASNAPRGEESGAESTGEITTTAASMAPASGCDRHSHRDSEAGGGDFADEGAKAKGCPGALGGSAVGKGGEKEPYGDDWGEVQVRHSGNFSNGNPLVTHAMGGINFQIEHHLFPSMSHMLYAEIAPIVRDACKEFDIPYNAHPSLWSAYKSYLKHLVVCSEVAASPCS